MLLITCLAVWPTGTPVITTGWDKSNHLLSFFVLLLLADFGWTESVPMPAKVLGLLCYGLIIELWQAAIPQRFFSLWDLVADGMGMTGYWLFRSRLLALRLPLQRLPFVKREFSASGDRD